MANKNKVVANTYIELDLSRNSKDKSSYTVYTNGNIMTKEYLEVTNASDIVSLVKDKINDMPGFDTIPVVLDRKGANDAIADMFTNEGIKVVQKNTNKNKDYYGYDDSSYYYYEPSTPWGVINFDDLEQAEAAADLTSDYLVLFVQFAEMGQRIITGDYYLEFGDERGKLALMNELTQQFMNRLEQVTAEHRGDMRKEVKAEPEVPAEIVVKEIEDKKPELVVKSKGVVLFKNAQDELIWAGVHSNKFQDRDKDILKEASHKLFVEKVYNGEYEYPELWIWHINKAVGDVSWLAYDERGFLLSGGKVFKQYEELVTELVKNTPEMGMSHGMPEESVLYDEEGYIKEYRSVEVTMLPLEHASNILTSFSVNKEK